MATYPPVVKRSNANPDTEKMANYIYLDGLIQNMVSGHPPECPETDLINETCRCGY